MEENDHYESRIKSHRAFKRFCRDISNEAGEILNTSGKIVNQAYFLSKMLQQTGIKHINFVVIGNSLASGYSMSEEIAPFFDQFRFIKQELLENGITSNIYNWAIPHDNSNEKILQILQENTSLEKIKRIQAYHLRFPYSIDNSDPIGFDDVVKYKTEGVLPLGEISKKTYDRYFKIQEGDENIKILDTLSDNNPEVLVIPIIMGNTGELCDTLSRGGNLRFLKENESLENRNLYDILQKIIEVNSSIMILVGQIPHFYLNKLPVSHIITGPMNRKIKDITDSMPGVYLTGAINFNLIHKNAANKPNNTILDVHGDALQYIKMTNKFMETINANYLGNRLAAKYRSITKKYIEQWMMNNTISDSTPRLMFDGEVLAAILDQAFMEETKCNDFFAQEYIRGIDEFLEHYDKRYHAKYFPTDPEKIHNQLENHKDKLR